MAGAISVSQSLTLANGRTLAYAEYGDPAGKPFFLFHGTPGSRRFGQVFDAAARAHGLRVIAPERPGYGLTSPAPRMTLLEYADEIGWLADPLGIERFGVLGVSGGGACAYACAYKLAPRLAVAGVLSSIAPLYLPGSMDGMLINNRIFLGYVGRLAPGVSAGLLGRLTLVSLGQADKHLNAGTSPSPAIPPETFALVIRDMREAFHAGTQGAAGDIRRLWRDWGFRFEDIRVPLLWWHGEADNLAPFAPAKAAADRVPNCTQTVFPGEGHVDPLIKHADEIIGALAAAFDDSTGD